MTPTDNTPDREVREKLADVEITAADRELLAIEYEQGGREGPYPTYAECARFGVGDFTLCSLRAIARARVSALRQPAGVSEETQFHLPLSVKLPMAMLSENHDPGERVILDAQGAHIGTISNPELAEAAVTSINRQQTVGSTDRAYAPPPAVSDEMVERAARIISPNCCWDDEINSHLERRKDNARTKARAALEAALSPQSASEPTYAPPVVTKLMVDHALSAWFSGPQSETDQGLERSMKAAIEAALRAATPTSGM